MRCKVTINTLRTKKNVEKFGREDKKAYLCNAEGENQVEPRCAERWHGRRAKPVEMMSNSTLPLGFLRSLRPTTSFCGVVGFYFYKTLAVELFFVRSAGSSDEIYQLHDLSTDLHLIIRMNYELRLPVSIDEALAIVIEVHLETVLGESYQVGIGYH